MFFVILLVFIGVVAFLYFDTRKPQGYPPGPRWLPFFGNFIYFRRRLRSLGYNHLVWQELSEKYGNLVGLRLGRDLVVTAFGATAVKEILTREEFNGRPDGFFFRLRTFGKRLGIVFSDGSHWEKQRKFSLQHLKHFGLGRREMESRIDEEARDLVDMLRRQCSGPILINNTFDISAINVLWAMMAGERFNLDDARLVKLLGIIHDAFKVVDISGGLLNQMPFLRYIAPKACGYTQTIHTLKRLWDFIEETISEHRRTVSSAHARDLIDAFLLKMEAKSPANATFTDDQLISLCLDMMMAGSETTSTTLSYCVIYMLQYPDVQKRVQKELDQIVGRDRWPTLQDRTRLTYTEAVIMEIQRRTNVPPLGISHRAVSTTYLFDYRIPKETIILPSLYSIHMDPLYWRDPLAFRPERHIKNGKIFFEEKHFAPFGYGKRRCLGESLAKATIFLIFTALLHNFHLKLAPGEPEPSLDGYDGVVLSPKPFKCLLVPR
ncbi:cytochrome p450 [Rhyzopertha dominica]|nr:cytochrome p450 [Rhyzopertha dominica]